MKRNASGTKERFPPSLTGFRLAEVSDLFGYHLIYAAIGDTQMYFTLESRSTRKSMNTRIFGGT